MSSPADLVVAARAADERVATAAADAEQARGDRDRIIAELYDQHGWTIRKIAGEVGVSNALVGQVCRRVGLERARSSRG